MRFSSGLVTERELLLLCATFMTLSRADVTVVRKCCDDEYIFNKGQCVFDPRPFQLPQLYTWPQVVPLNDTEIRLEYGFPQCDTYTYYLDPFEDPSEEFNVLENGWLLRGDGRRDPPGQFCLETIASEKAVRPVSCFPGDEEPEDDEARGMFAVYPMGMIVSVPFLVITLIVYGCVKDLHSLHGWCLMSHVTALIFSYSSLTTVQIISTSLDYLTCTIFGFAVQFFFLATFFWLNVMCIDICWAFSGFKLLRGSALERDRKKLLFYSLYAWGMPLLILTITVGVDYSDAIPASSLFKPGIGTEKCFFKGRVATWVYFYGPMGVVILCNAVLYTVTAIRLCRHRRETAVLKRGDSRKHDGNDKERFNLYLKLFLVMGINWVSELVSYMFGNEVPKYMWYATDITNTLQGLFIFLIFVWKKRVRRLVWNKLCKSRSQSNGGPRGSIQTTNTASNSSSTPSNSIKLNQVFFSCCFDTKADKEENKTPQKSFELPTLSVDISRKDSEQNGYYKKMEVLTMENIQALLCAF